METQRTIQAWPVAGIQPHPQNRKVKRDAKYAELIESIKAIGVQQPLIVRSIPGRHDMVECLSGHRRGAAAIEAGLTTVPVDHRGEISDAEAFDIMAISNLHEELSPLEEGQRAAMWLDHYDQDAQAVASKLGKTPRWVVEHAQIHRNLVADWHQAAESGKTSYGSSLAEQLDRWTASHWAVIARLPQRIQLQQLKKFQSGSYCSFDRWTVKDLEERIGLEMLSLAKAPFDVATCRDCLNRTGAQPAFLWADDVDGAVGDKEKCLDAKCYQRKCEKAQKAEFAELRRQKNYPDAVPLSTLVQPQDWYKRAPYDKQMRALKKVHGKDLVIADAVEMVKKGKDWDVFPERRPKDVRPAIVVAGKGKGTVVWIKPKPASKAATAKQPASQKQSDADWRSERERLATKCGALYAAILAVKLDVYQGLALAILMDTEIGGEAKDLSLLTKHREDHEALGQVCMRMIADRAKADLALRAKNKYLGQWDWEQALPAAELLGIDVEKIAAEAEKPETGEPCTWVEPDLCSRCAAKMPLDGPPWDDGGLPAPDVPAKPKTKKGGKQK